jgi:hypothetical protein
MMGVLMLVVTIVALGFNLGLLVQGQGSGVVTGVLGIVVGVGSYVVGEIRRDV